MVEPSSTISLLEDDCTPPPKKKASTGEPSTSLDTCMAQLYGPSVVATLRCSFLTQESESNSEEEDDSGSEQGDKEDETDEGSSDDEQPDSEQYSLDSGNGSDDKDDFGGWEDDDGGSQYGESGTGDRKKDEENAGGSEDEGSGNAGGEEIKTNSGEGGGPSSKIRIGRTYRKYKYCPVKGKQPLKKLSNHLTRQHPKFTEDQRRRCPKQAKLIQQSPPVVIAGQPTLHSLLAVTLSAANPEALSTSSASPWTRARR